MSTANSLRITLELEAGADPIRGLIEHADGSRRPFWGWLELIEAMQRAAADQPERTDARAERRKRHTTGEEHS